MTLDHRIKNSLIGLALGDAWGKDTEFVPYEYLVRDKYDASDPFLMFDGKRKENLIVTDDTQMSIYVVKALKSINDFYNYDEIKNAFNTAFIEWFDDEKNTHDRAPGNTCMSSISLMKEHKLSPFANLKHDGYTNSDSMGCGTIMRSGWIGLDSRIPEGALENVTQIQSEITHGHPLATASSVIFAKLIREIRTTNIQSGDYIDWIEQEVSHHPEWYELNEYFKNIPTAVNSMNENPDDLLAYDPCSDLGGGWIAPESFALAIAIGQVYEDKPIMALRRSSITGGDSDSIGAIAGTLLGAGKPDFIEEWNVYYEQLEPFYKETIDNDIYPYLTETEEES